MCVSYNRRRPFPCFFALAFFDAGGKGGPPAERGVIANGNGVCGVIMGVCGVCGVRPIRRRG